MAGIVFFNQLENVCELWRMFKWFAIIFVIITICYSCKNDTNRVTPSFYYWQSNFELNSETQDRLSSLRINNIYVKFFDVTWNEAARQPIPVADVKFATKIPDNLSIIPVVFITNKTLENIDSSETKILAQKIAKRIQGVIDSNKINQPKEIQIDCDWTITTRQNYFILLEALKAYPTFEKIIWSATIRLHQIKFASTTGVPPVDKGLLMFYNTGDIENDNTNNSIYDYETAAQYVQHAQHYALPLDAAIACYSWGLLYDNHKLIKIFYPLYPEQIDNNRFEKIAENKFKAKGNFYFEGQFFVESNILKLEIMTPELSLQSAQQLAEHLKNEQINVILFHLDSTILKKYSNEDLEAIYNCFE